MQKWLALALVGSVLTVGCTGGGQQQQAQPEPSSEQVERAVKKTLHDEDMKDFMRMQVRDQAGTELLEMALDTSEGQKAVAEAVKRNMSSSVGQQAITQQVGQMMSDPAFKTQIQLAIREALTDMLAKGVETKKGSDKEKSKSESGGGSSGGGGGGS